jgi:hypothetical protein
MADVRWTSADSGESGKTAEAGGGEGGLAVARAPVMRLFILLVPIALGCAVDPQGDDRIDQPLTSEVPVYLNHALGMQPSATIDALQKNQYLGNAFIDVEVRTTVRPDVTYTGTYLNGRVTYVELFTVGTLGIPRNVFELALGTELVHSAEVVQQKWNAEFGEHETAIPLFFRRVNGVDVPWFRAVIPAWTSTAQSVGLFNEEYVPNPGSTVPRTRLEERAARYQPSKLARDVQAFVFAAPPGEIDLLRRALVSLGWSAAARDRGFLALSPLDNGTRRALVVEESAPADAGMLGVVFGLNRRAQHTEQIGDAVLKVGLLGQPVAVLWFAPPPAQAESDVSAAVSATVR